jgi:YidC/Oxa1 family membrane protein insertase
VFLRFGWVMLWTVSALARGASLELAFNPQGGQPRRLLACYLGCEHDHNPNYRLDFQAQQPALQWWVASDELQQVLEKSRFTVVQEERGWQVTSAPLPDGLRLQFHYRLGNTPFELLIESRWLNSWGQSVEAASPVGWTVQAPSSFARSTSGGFADSHEKTEAVGLQQGSWMSGEELQSGTAYTWWGVRNRFWALLVEGSQSPWQPAADGRLIAPPGHALRLYVGPIDRSSLAAVDPELTGLLFSNLWFWMRWLSLAILLCLNGLGELLGHWGWAIVLLSLVVKIALTPLSHVATQWQRQVNRTKSALEPGLQHIRQQYRGEERNRMILALHREQGVSIFYTTKSALGFLIQIPVFIAAFHVLNESFGLNGASFGFIPDLAKPDHWLKLPVVLPFFGGYFNAMPLLMTLITLLTSWRFYDPSLSESLRKSQQRQLYLVALVFFVLFYTFPAGMVLYWTTNNVWQYMKDSVNRLRLRTAE